MSNIVVSLNNVKATNTRRVDVYSINMSLIDIAGKFGPLYDLSKMIISFLKRMDIYNSVSKTTDLLANIDSTLLNAVDIHHLVLNSTDRVLIIKYIYKSILGEFKTISSVVDTSDNRESMHSISSVLDLFLGHIENLTRMIDIYRTSSILLSNASGWGLFAIEFGNDLLLDEEISIWLAEILSETNTIKTKLSY